jgi:hypothetical protein
MAKEKIEILELRKVITQNILTIKDFEARIEPLQTERAEFRKSLDKAEKDLTNAQENVKSLSKNLEQQKISYQELDKEIDSLKQNFKENEDKSSIISLELEKLGKIKMVEATIADCLKQDFYHRNQKEINKQISFLNKTILEKEESLKKCEVLMEKAKADLQECLNRESTLKKEKNILSENPQYLTLEKQIKTIDIETRYLKKQLAAHEIFEREIFSSSDSSDYEVLFRYYKDAHKLRLNHENNKYKLSVDLFTAQDQLNLQKLADSQYNSELRKLQENHDLQLKFYSDKYNLDLNLLYYQRELNLQKLPDSDYNLELRKLQENHDLELQKLCKQYVSELEKFSDSEKSFSSSSSSSDSSSSLSSSYSSSSSSSSDSTTSKTSPSFSSASAIDLISLVSLVSSSSTGSATSEEVSTAGDVSQEGEDLTL